MIPLNHYPGPGLFITATGTEVGKTTVTGALAAALTSLRTNVGLLKPIGSGCPKNPNRGNVQGYSLDDDDLMPLDALAAAQGAGMDVRDEGLWPMMSPIRYAAPVSPALAARIESRPPKYGRVAKALGYWQTHCDVLLVEGAGGWLTPLDADDHTIADLAAAIKLPVVVVASAFLGTINTTMLTVNAIRQRGLPVAGVILNCVPVEERRDLVAKDNLLEIPRLCNVPLLGVLPKLSTPLVGAFPDALVSPLLPFAQVLAKVAGK